jgi:HNH endonuclease
MPRNLWKNVPMLKRFERKYIPEPNSGCWLWTGVLHEGGYGEFREAGSRIRAHVWAYKTFVGSIPVGLFVLHKCDVRSCVNPEHLYVGTKRQNTADAIARDRFPRGENHSATTLNESQIVAIRKDLRKQRDIAADYGVQQMTISNIKRRVTWRHVP